MYAFKFCKAAIVAAATLPGALEPQGPADGGLEPPPINVQRPNGHAVVGTPSGAISAATTPHASTATFGVGDPGPGAPDRARRRMGQVTRHLCQPWRLRMAAWLAEMLAPRGLKKPPPHRLLVRCRRMGPPL